MTYLIGDVHTQTYMHINYLVTKVQRKNIRREYGRTQYHIKEFWHIIQLTCFLKTKSLALNLHYDPDNDVGHALKCIYCCLDIDISLNKNDLELIVYKDIRHTQIKRITLNNIKN